MTTRLVSRPAALLAVASGALRVQYSFPIVLAYATTRTRSSTHTRMTPRPHVLQFPHPVSSHNLPRQSPGSNQISTLVALNASVDSSEDGPALRNNGEKVKMRRTIARGSTLSRRGKKGRRMLLTRRRRKSLPKWFRRLLLSSKFSSVFNKIVSSSSSSEEGTLIVADTEEGRERPASDGKAQPTYRLPGSRALRLILSNPLVEFKLALLVLLSSVFVAAGTVQSIPPFIHSIIGVGENFVAIIFLLEYFLRWYCNGLRLGHLIKPLVIVDLLSILPLAFHALPGLVSCLPFGTKVLEDNLLVNLRLLRLLRFQRFLVDFDTFERFQLAIGVRWFVKDVRKYHLQLARVIITIFTLQSVAAGLVFAAEHAANPSLSDYPTALYFVLTTVTTVGFGDIVPITAVGRVVVCATIFAGAAIIPIQLSAFVNALLDFRRDLEAKRIAGKQTTTNRFDDNEKAYELVDELQSDGSYCKVKTNALLCCPICNAKPHRETATFCWCCGSPLWGARERASYLQVLSDDDNTDGAQR